MALGMQGMWRTITSLGKGLSFGRRLPSSQASYSSLWQGGNLEMPRPIVLLDKREEIESLLLRLGTCEVPISKPFVPRQAWLESMRDYDEQHLGLVDLHPDVFGVPPRLDILHQVVAWQRNYKRISHAHTKTRAEVRGGGRKPRPQKGTGRSRQGSIRSPIWRGGGVAHGPRGPKSYYYMLPMKIRVLGLKVALTIKHAQDDLHIIDSVDLPTADPQYMMDFVRYRHWGDSVLIVDINDQMPENIVKATETLNTIGLIPAVAINVYSMLKYQTLVLTLPTVRFLEKKLLWHDTRFAPLYPYHMPYRDIP
uniref:Large ribosomal subunit protein uL4m n=1 Tax=Eptatretus burgeri TaxID=7764 RepID=A0A8C4R9W6_EPTBU